MYTLRPYQQAAVESVFRYFENHAGNPVVAMPTGTGKALLVAEIIRRVMAYPSQRVLMLTHVKELLQQNAEKLLAMWNAAPLGIYSAGLGMREVRPITFAGVASAWKKPELFGKVDLCIVDECHLVSDKQGSMYQKLFDALRATNPLLKIIGLSATPYRLKGGMLTEGGLFTDICFDNTRSGDFLQLIKDGFLAMLVPKATSETLDVSGVRMSGGDFVQHALQAAVDREAVTRAALDETVPAAAVHSQISNDERARILDSFKAGRIRAVVNNNVLTTGFDFPGIDCIIMLRPTASPGLWVQMLGRGTRPAPGKENCLVLDFAANTRRLGPVNDPILPKRKGKGGGAAPVRECPECACYCHASARVCPFCGFEFPRKVNFGAVAAGEALIIDSAPVVTSFAVHFVTYAKHRPRDKAKPPSLKVSYQCGMRVFAEWVCFEHKGFALRKALAWWTDRNGDKPFPETIDEALTRVDDLFRPTRIKVWTNKKFPEIISAVFGGPAPDAAEPAPDDDDDIPF